MGGGSYYASGAGGFIGVAPHASGSRYVSQIVSSTTTSATTASRLIVTPFWVPSSGTYDRIGAEVTSGAAASTVRLGIWADTGSFYPGSLVLDAGTIDGNSATFQEITISQYLSQGVVWIGAAAQGGTPTLRWINTSIAILPQLSTNTGISVGYFQASVTGAFDASFAASQSVITSAPRVLMRRA